MLVSRTEVLAQDLRRQDLLTQALHDRVAQDHSLPAECLRTTAAMLRQAFGTVLIRAGERLRRPSTAAVAPVGDPS